MSVVGVIPARYASTRFPGKPLALVAGKPLIEHVVERCRAARSLSEVIVATDDEWVAEAVRSFGGRVEITSAAHETGTDRLAEVAARIDADAAAPAHRARGAAGPRAVRRSSRVAGRSSGRRST